MSCHKNMSSTDSKMVFKIKDMRSILKLLLLTAIALWSFAIYAQRPNIIVFMVDDMGWQDCSVPFGDAETPLNKKFHTPNMEKLADQGMKFTNAYSNSVCTPTRISFLTGMNAAHHRVTNWTSVDKNDATDYPDSLLLPPAWNINGLSPVKDIPKTVYATPLPLLLNEVGYQTIHVGKAHWGSMGTPGSNPYSLGFIVNIAGNAIGHPQSYLGEENYGNLPKKTTMNAVPDLGEYFGSDTFLTQALTLEALKALDAPVRNKQPFFLHLAHYAVHTPIMEDKRFVQKYLDDGMDPVEARYASLIEGMDKSLGDVMAYLKENKIEDNTIIIFMSDNGGLSLVPPRGGKPHTQNLPLRAGKGSLYEGGIREPMIVKWPGVAEPKTIADQYLQIQDFFPTILEMAGIMNSKTVQDIDGKSFMPVLKNSRYADTSSVLIWHYPNRWTTDTTEALCFVSAIRQGNWKLIYKMKEKKLELYNLKNDIGEQKNLSSENPQKTKEMAHLLTVKLKSYDALMPTYKATGKSAAWPEDILKSQ